jgi:coatomer subunit epsilon
LQGGEKYQAAYYVFEELAQAPATQSVQMLVAQAVAELHLGRLPEAEAAMQQAVELSPDHPEVLANTIVLNTVLGKPAEAKEAKAKLEKAQPSHQALSDWAQKKSEFDAACGKYTPKFEP